MLLGPNADAVRMAGDKLLLSRHLLASGVRTPPCSNIVQFLRGGPTISPLSPEDGGQGACVGAALPHQLGSLADVSGSFPAVYKPRCGAGSQATFLVNNTAELANSTTKARSEGWHGEMIVQPLVPGLPVSAALLLGPRHQVALPAGSQELSTDGRFRYRGGTLPLHLALSERACRLAWQAVGTIPGLRGYVGVDLVLGDSPDGSQDWVIEINPRLTTAYVGLRRLALSNLAGAMVNIVAGMDVRGLHWRPGTVTFRADGTVAFWNY